MSLVADYAASDDDSRPQPPDAPPGGPANAPPAKVWPASSIHPLIHFFLHGHGGTFVIKVWFYRFK